MKRNLFWTREIILAAKEISVATRRTKPIHISTSIYCNLGRRHETHLLLGFPYHLLHLTRVESHMKFLLLSVLASTAVNTATCYTTPFTTKGFTARPPTFLAAEIRPPSSKAKELRFGWDGTTALGGAEVDSKPARMLDDIKASGETLHPDGGENTNRRLIGV